MKDNQKKVTSLKQNRNGVIFFVVLLFIIAILSVYIISRSVIQPGNSEEKLFDYKLENQLLYRVYLYPNSFFEEPYLDMEKHYTSELVKYIDINFINNLNLSELGVINYDYDIKAEINGLYSNNSNSSIKDQVWHKSFVLLESKSDTVIKNNNMISENYQLDFGYFNQLVADFKSELRINIDATLSVYMTINYDIEVEDEVLSRTQVLRLDIPLNLATFKITTTLTETEVDAVYNVQEQDDSIAVIPFIIGSITFTLSLVFLINETMKLLRLNKKTEYVNKLNKILKSYGDIIAESDNLPDYSKLDVINITNFEDLVDIENEMRIPIIYYERIKDIEGWFVLINGNHLYRYILKCDKQDPFKINIID